MEHILKNWGNSIRFIVILSVIYLAINLIVNKFVNNTQFSIDFKTDKTLVTLIDKKNVIANSVLPACDCWIRTGIEIRPNEEYEIKVSGKIHTKADRLIEDAISDIKPRFNWIGPEGSAFIIREDGHKRSDEIRKTLLLSPNANLGAVLFYFQKGNSKAPECQIGNGFYLPDSVIIYNKEGLRGKNNDNETWFVWASVNDLLLRDFQLESNKLAYLGSAKYDSLKIKEKQWAKLAEENYNRLWFDDNFGNFVISAKIVKPVSIFDF